MNVKRNATKYRIRISAPLPPFPLIIVPSPGMKNEASRLIAAFFAPLQALESDGENVWRGSEKHNRNFATPMRRARSPWVCTRRSSMRRGFLRVRAAPRCVTSR